MEKDGCKSSLKTLRVLRVSLVDQLEGWINGILDSLVSSEVFTRDDREVVLSQTGPRGRVRKVLDILICKGEEAAETFLSIISHHQQQTQTHSMRRNGNETGSTEYNKTMQKHKQVIRRRSESMLYYNTRHGEKIPFLEHYVNLLLVNGHQDKESKRHEVLAFGRTRLSFQQKSHEHRQITPDQLFSNRIGSRPAKKILVTGVAGIGKTILVQKMLLDFGNNKDYLSFDFVIHITFRDLNLINKPTSFRDLVLRKNGHLAKELDNILAAQSKLLIVLDGFDEFRHYSNCDEEVFVNEPDQDGEVAEVFASLMLGELLPEASVLLTSRPTAISHIPVGCIDRFVLIAGFSLTEVQDYFRRYFQDKILAEQMFALVAANELMLTLCYIPAFCSIVCCIIKESKDLSEGIPNTMTDIYVQYLMAMMQSHTRDRDKSSLIDQIAGALPQLSEIMLRLGQLAFHKLMAHQTIFYDSDTADLKGCSLVSTFLDKTVAQEPGCTEDVYSFTHLTVQEFFAAIYCAFTDQPLLESHKHQGIGVGHLQLFNQFLYGIMSERNTKLLSRQVGLHCQSDKVEALSQRMVTELKTLCESGGPMLNHLHCFFERQDPSLAHRLQPDILRVNISDETLSPMDYNAINYFLNLSKGSISELDLTGTDISSEALRELQPHLLRCERLWLGDNVLDMDTVQVIADVLQVSDCITHLGLGWSNIGDEELLVLSDAVRINKRPIELWLEGNRISYSGLLSLNDLTPNPLTKVVAIWNDFTDKEADTLRATHGVGCYIVDFNEDQTWQAWGQWVFDRCEASSNEKLIMVLYKVCNIPVHHLELPWAVTFYKRLAQLVKSRIEQCTEHDVRKKLERFAGVLSS